MNVCRQTGFPYYTFITICIRMRLRIWYWFCAKMSKFFIVAPFFPFAADWAMLLCCSNFANIRNPNPNGNIQKIDIQIEQQSRMIIAFIMHEAWIMPEFNLHGHFVNFLKVVVTYALVAWSAPTANSCQSHQLILLCNWKYMFYWSPGFACISYFVYCINTYLLHQVGSPQRRKQYFFNKYVYAMHNLQFLKFP